MCDMDLARKGAGIEMADKNCRTCAHWTAGEDGYGTCGKTGKVALAFEGQWCQHYEPQEAATE